MRNVIMPTPLNRRDFLAASGAALAATALPSSATISSSEIRQWDMTADVVIAGSGAAGTSAAIEARNSGADVLVLEKLLKLGGSSAMSGGVIYMGGNTPLQKACGFDDTVEDMANFITGASRKHADLDKIQLYCEQSVEHFHWLVEMGVPYKNSYTDVKGLPGTDDSLYYSGNELAWPDRDMAKPAPRGHVPSELGWTGGRLLMNTLIASAQKIGVNYLTQISCERLIQERDGRVVGLLVLIDGEQKAIRARKGVILACGGFIHNREMVKLYAPELYDCSVPWGGMADLGMGIQMGIAAGGATIGMDQGFTIMPLYQPDHVLKGIVVNQSGQRFVTEDSYHAVVGNEITFHQKGVAYLITDSDSQYGYDDYRVKVKAQADSIESLEQQLGLPPQQLLHTVSYYNQHAVNGEDPLFHKSKKYLQSISKGPFFAYDLSVDTAFFPAHTFGGLHTSINSEVLNAWGEAIPGLYAAGRTTTGLPSSPYIASGISVGDCTFFGRQAGKAVNV
jgi:3-oxo-5alpha-steroid 4-dehydrogenase